MMQTKSISDLRNRFTEIEDTVDTGQLVFLTKNGNDSMVDMGLDRYAELVEDVEQMLDEADHAAAISDVRYSHDDVFAKLKRSSMC